MESPPGSLIERGGSSLHACAQRLFNNRILPMPYSSANIASLTTTTGPLTIRGFAARTDIEGNPCD